MFSMCSLKENIVGSKLFSMFRILFTGREFDRLWVHMQYITCKICSGIILKM